MSNKGLRLRDTIVPKSDQLNAEQLLSGPITIVITRAVLQRQKEQPLWIYYEGDDGRPYKPCLTMRKVLDFAWGDEGDEWDETAWAGRRLTLYNQRDVKFGGEEVGGIRISEMSDIQADIEIRLTATRGKKAPVRINRLIVSDANAEARSRLEAAARGGMAVLRAAWEATPSQQKTAIGPRGCPDELKRIATDFDAAEAERKARAEHGTDDDIP